ncbi:hypothetical protein [Arcobacter roscoffensis]|uniref:Pentapeptide repeat-containing protein n=1 Tax=Arcobacter roscoffensis TaxID=2961520 RepID=A0ABY5E6K6_9BACT|nr:hypothetical protein [Arcobacter roscoffensis]UTJ07789.1 hypothetical protein NJU99_06745 [Arcobacter roscoffensis]
MAKCSIEHCNLDVYESDSKCILHCQKHEYSVDFNKIGFLKAFYDELVNSIIRELSSDYSEQKLSLYFKDELDEADSYSVDEYIKEEVIVFNNIYFPQSKEIDSFDYTKILKRLGQIHFNYCEFSTSYLDLDSTKCFFQDCKFHNGLSLSNIPVLENELNVLFQKCEFGNTVSSSPWDKQLVIDSPLFSDCSFTKINFDNTIFNEAIFKNSKDFDGSIKELEIYDSVLKKEFVLDYHSIDSLIIRDTQFQEPLHMYKCRNINELNITNSSFEKSVDFYNSSLGAFYTSNTLFSEFVNFEYCEFGLGEGIEEYFKAKFDYTTFKSFINFRNTFFYSGLDLSLTNLKENPNFLNTTIDYKYTNKETFRIIKNSFDKVGNFSDANKFFAKEMQKDLNETFFLDSPAKKLMLWFNLGISNFGQFYWLPLLYIIGFSFLLSFINYEELKCCEILNPLAKTLPFGRFLDEGKEFVHLLVYIVYSVLIYHFIVSVKRMIKR